MAKTGDWRDTRWYDFCLMWRRVGMAYGFDSASNLGPYGELDTRWYDFCLLWRRVGAVALTTARPSCKWWPEALTALTVFP